MRTNCDFCNSTALVKLSTSQHQDLPGHGFMFCVECDKPMPWNLKPGQRPLVAPARMGKTNLQN